MLKLVPGSLSSYVSYCRACLRFQQTKVGVLYGSMLYGSVLYGSVFEWCVFLHYPSSG